MNQMNLLVNDFMITSISGFLCTVTQPKFQTRNMCYSYSDTKVFVFASEEVKARKICCKFSSLQRNRRQSFDPSFYNFIQRILEFCSVAFFSWYPLLVRLLRFKVSLIVLIGLSFTSIQKVTSMKQVPLVSTCWIQNGNQKNCFTSKINSALRGGLGTSNSKVSTPASNGNRGLTMTTDSRELRFREGTPKFLGSSSRPVRMTAVKESSVYKASQYSNTKSNNNTPQMVEDTTRGPLLGQETCNPSISPPPESYSFVDASISINRSNIAIKKLSKMSVIEELISTSYTRALEENYEMVAYIFSPLIQTIQQNKPIKRELQSHGQQMQSRGQFDLAATLTTLGPVKSYLDRYTKERWTKASTFSPPVGKSVFGASSTQNAASTKANTQSAPIKQNERNYSTFSLNGARQGRNKDFGNQRGYHNQDPPERPVRTGYGNSIQLTDDEHDLFQLLRRVRKETGLSTTLRVAGGWVRDKLLSTPEFQTYHKVFSVGKEASSNGKVSSTNQRLTSKFRRHRTVQTTQGPSMGRQGTKILTTTPTNDCQPVDIDIALDDMLGREFADHLNDYLTKKGEEAVSVGVVLKNPEKSKHLETATMKINSFWIDFVNLRAEEYTQDSRIPDLMRIGTADEDAYRRDLTINSLFFNINTGEIEDWTGRGFDDLRKGIIATPLPPLTTLLDDPLRVLRSIRFAARLRFSMDDELINAARNIKVATALLQKVSRERVGGELDLMLRSPDPVGAVRLLINLNLISCVFPITKYMPTLKHLGSSTISAPNSMTLDKVLCAEEAYRNDSSLTNKIFQRGLELLSTAHDHLADCKWSPPVWCSKNYGFDTDESNGRINKDSFVCYGATEIRLLDDEDSRRLLWYASFITPIYEEYQNSQDPTSDSSNEAGKSQKVRSEGKKANRSIISRILVDELKRPNRDSESVEKLIKASDDFIQLVNAGCDVSATMILLSEIRIVFSPDENTFKCYMHGREIDSSTELDPVWEHAMEFRLLCSKVLLRIGPLWRAAMCLSIARELVSVLSPGGEDDKIKYAIEGDVVDESQEECRQGVIEKFDVFATGMQQMGLIGIWNEKALASGDVIRKEALHAIPPGPAFRDIMDEQTSYMTTHPGCKAESVLEHLKRHFPEYVEKKSV